MTRVYVNGIGMAAAGLPDWAAARPVLRGEAAYEPAPCKPATTALLPRNEARRAGLSVRLAFQAAEQACAGADAAELPAVFATSSADNAIADRLCRDIVDPEGAVSPTRFHNSVHNTAAGYWSIATGAREGASSVSGGPDSFAVGLCEAWGMLATEGGSVLLVAFEAAGGGMLEAARPNIADSCAISLLLSNQPVAGAPALTGLTSVAEPATTLADPELEHYRRCNPAARSLALLQALAADAGGRVVLDSSQGNLALTVGPGA